MLASYLIFYALRNLLKTLDSLIFYYIHFFAHGDQRLFTTQNKPTAFFSWSSKHRVLNNFTVNQTKEIKSNSLLVHGVKKYRTQSQKHQVYAYATTMQENSRNQNHVGRDVNSASDDKGCHQKMEFLPSKASICYQVSSRLPCVDSNFSEIQIY